MPEEFIMPMPAVKTLKLSKDNILTEVVVPELCGSIKILMIGSDGKFALSGIEGQPLGKNFYPLYDEKEFSIRWAPSGKRNSLRNFFITSDEPNATVHILIEY